MPGLPTTDKRFRRAHVKPSRKRNPASKHAWLAARLVALWERPAEPRWVRPLRVCLFPG